MGLDRLVTFYVENVPAGRWQHPLMSWRSFFLATHWYPENRTGTICYTHHPFGVIEFTILVIHF